MKSEDFIQLRLLLGTYVTAPFCVIVNLDFRRVSGLIHHQVGVLHRKMMMNMD